MFLRSLLIFALAFCVHTAHAQRLVDELPDATLPSLPALGAPEEETDVATMADPTFAAKLEKVADLRSALLEWERIVHISEGSSQALALLKVGELALKTGEQERARKALEKFTVTFPKDSRLAEALYLLSQAVPADERASVLHLMERIIPDNKWTKEAIYHAVWDQAKETGNLPEENYADQRIQQLERRLDRTNTWIPNDAVMTVMALIPGTVQLWFGDLNHGLIYLLATALLLWAVVYAVKHQHMPYALCWAGVLGYMAYAAHKEAIEMSGEIQYTNRVEAMESWAGLKPGEIK